MLSSIGQDYADANRAPQDFLPDAAQQPSDGSFGSSSREVGSSSREFGNGYGDQGLSDQDYFDQGGNNFNQNGSCDTCGNDLVDGACSTCGPGAGYTDGPVIRDYGTFGSVSAANRYLYLDALIWTRADGDIANSNFGTLNDFDFTGGLRVTYGTRDDSIFGREITFMGLPGVDQEISRSDAAGQLTPPGFITLPISFAPSDAFLNATSQTQSKESDLYSIEFNRVNWGWDLIKSFTGFRFLRFDDSYSVTSSNDLANFDPLTGTATGANGDFTLDAANTLLGGQIGGELFYDIGYRWSASGFGKFGLFANFNDFDTNYNNDEFNVSTEDDSVTLSTVAELGILAHYQIRTNLRFRAGYNLLFVGNVSTVADNITQSASQFIGAEITDSDDVLFHGFNFGLEFYR